MALLLPNLRSETRSVMPIALVFVSLLGAIASAECGDHLKPSSHASWLHTGSFGPDELNPLAVHSLTANTDHSSGSILRMTFSRSPGKSQKVCWSCRGAVPTGVTPTADLQPKVATIASETELHCDELVYGLPQDVSLNSVLHFGHLLRPPIV